MQTCYSPYVFFVDYPQRNCRLLLNTENGKIGVLPTNDDELSEADLDYLRTNGFMSTNSKESGIETDNRKSDDAIISIETSLLCNLNCPYCYQKSITHNNKTQNDFDFIQEYISYLFNEKRIRNIHLKILGGEPSLSATAISEFLSRLQELRNKGMYLFLYFDTNGVSLMSFAGYDTLADSISFNIPLCHKSVHDKERCKNNGEGTYDIIIGEIAKYHEASPSTEFVIRHNTNDNYALFESFCEDIKNKIPFVNLNICYVVESSVYRNPLSYVEYLSWLYSEALPAIWKRNLSFVNTPIKKIRPCQFYQDYSVKFFSNNKVGRCATDYWKPCISFSEFKANNYILNKEPFHINDNCKMCNYIYLCSNSINYPCRSLINENACIFKELSEEIINPFVKLLYEAYLKGNHYLFVGYYGLKHLV